MKKLIIGITFIVFGIGSFYFLSEKEDHEYSEQVLKKKNDYEQQAMNNRACDMINGAKTIEDLEIVENMSLNKANDKLVNHITLKKSTLWFEKAENCLSRAIEIERASAINTPPPPPVIDPSNPDYDNTQPPPPEPKPLHPLAFKLLNEAIDCYDKARKESEKLSDTGSKDFDFHVNYLKGEIYYRFLEILGDQETAQELFNQTLTYYKYALRHRPGDINTVINIELLIKNQNSLLANASNPNAKRKQMLNSKKFGINKHTGN